MCLVGAYTHTQAGDFKTEKVSSIKKIIYNVTCDVWFFMALKSQSWNIIFGITEDISG